MTDSPSDAVRRVVDSFPPLTPEQRRALRSILYGIHDPIPEEAPVTQQRGNILPTIGQHVHYVSHGSADGTYPSVCRAAIVTEVPEKVCEGGDWVENTDRASLCVLNPTGQFFSEGRRYVEAREMRGGTWHWPCELRRARVEHEEVMIVPQGKEMLLNEGEVEPYRPEETDRGQHLTDKAVRQAQDGDPS